MGLEGTTEGKVRACRAVLQAIWWTGGRGRANTHHIRCWAEHCNDCQPSYLHVQLANEMVKLQCHRQIQERHTEHQLIFQVAPRISFEAQGQGVCVYVYLGI